MSKEFDKVGGGRVTAYKTDLDRLESYDRAMVASGLIRNKEFYEETEKLARSTNKEGSKDSFTKLCKKAGIENDHLIDHMWTIIKACAHDEGQNYLAENPGPLW